MTLSERLIRMIVTVLLSLLVGQAQLQLIELNPATFDVVVPEVTSQLSSLLQDDFTVVREVVTALDGAYTQCTDFIKEQLFDQCFNCVAEKCQIRATEVCNSDGDPVAPAAALVQEDFGCQLSPVACTLVTVGNKAKEVLQKAAALVKGTVQNVIKGAKNVVKGVKKIIGGIGLPRIRLPRIRIPRIRIRLPRIRLPRIRLPRIRLPRIRLPRIRLPRIRLPRIRLPRIRLPRIRLPRIRLPRIRLPRIRLPRIRLPRIRFPRIRIFKRKRRQATEPTCKELADNPETACQFYSAECPSCAGVTGADELQLIETNCGAQFKEIFTDLRSQENRLARLEEIYNISDPNIFSIDTIRYDPSKYDAAAPGYPNVHVNYTLLGSPTTLLLTDPVNLLDPVSTIVNITQLVYDQLFKFTLT